VTIASPKEIKTKISSTVPLSVSVVIPTLNEAGNISQAIAKAQQIKPLEVIVVDGGSQDGTLKKAEEADCCLVSPAGRSLQMNAGAEIARGDVLLFLHADCWLEEGAIEAIQRSLQQPEIVGGCFRQKIESPGLLYRMLERGNSFRVKMLKWAYGDQGIFVRNEVFLRVGGFPAIQLMEDLYLMKNLKRLGKIELVDHPITISARRWKAKGVARQTLRNWLLITLAQCGVSPDRLAWFYESVR